MGGHMETLKVSEVWRKRFGHEIPLFDISKNDDKIVLYLNDYHATGNNNINKFILLGHDGNIIKEEELGPDFSVSDLKIVSDKIICIDFFRKSFKTYDLSLNLQSSGIFQNENFMGRYGVSHIFAKKDNWYVFSYPVGSDNGKKILTCFKNGSKLWKKNMYLRAVREITTRHAESQLLHIITKNQKNDSGYQIVVMDFDGNSLFEFNLPTKNDYPAFSSQNLTAIGEDDFYPEPCQLSVFDNSGKLLFKKQLRIEPHDVFISKNELIFVSLHSEYDGDVGGIVVYDKYGNEVIDVNTRRFASKPVQTNNGKAVIIPSGGEKTLVFDENAKLMKTIENTQTFHVAAGTNYILTKNEPFSANSVKTIGSELILLKIE